MAKGTIESKDQIKFLPFAIQRFWNKVIQRDSGECWGWKGYIDRNGVSKFAIQKMPENIKIPLAASRVSYIFNIGDIPEGLHVLHTCDNPECTNPKHLFVGTHTDNVKDMDAKGRRGTTEGYSHSDKTRQKLSESARRRYARRA